jgi:hypothetical protein
MKRPRLFWQSIVVVAFAAVGTLFAAQTGDALKPQGDFKHWYLVHSTLITKDENKLGLIAGVHLIYVNAAGLVGRGRSHEANRHRLSETMLQLPCAPEGAGLHVLEVSRVTRALAEAGERAPGFGGHHPAVSEVGTRPGSFVVDGGMTRV